MCSTGKTAPQGSKQNRNICNVNCSIGDCTSVVPFSGKINSLDLSQPLTFSDITGRLTLLKEAFNDKQTKFTSSTPSSLSNNTIFSDMIRNELLVVDPLISEDALINVKPVCTKDTCNGHGVCSIIDNVLFCYCYSGRYGKNCQLNYSEYKFLKNELCNYLLLINLLILIISNLVILWNALSSDIDTVKPDPQTIKSVLFFLNIAINIFQDVTNFFETTFYTYYKKVNI